MSPWADIARSIADATATQFPIEARTPVGGGCINAAFRVTGSGRAYFVKTSAPHAADMFAAEAAGLAEIARSQTVRVPQPVCHGGNNKASWLVLEWIEFGGPGRDSGRALGQSLAAMHSKQLYNLYHVLNHYNLFGGGYARQAETMADRLLAEI